MIGVLSAEDVAIVRAEQRGADFGVLVEVGTGTAGRAELEQALTVVLAHWPSLTARISRDGETLTVHADPPATVRDLEHEGDLRGCTVLASRGERLLRYRFDENRRMLQLLGHHVVLDADSLDALLADLDAVLVGRELAGSPEWPWERIEDRRTLTCVVAQGSDITTMPDGRPRREAERARRQPTAERAGTSDGGAAPLAASSRPKPSAHASRSLEPDLVDRTARAAKSSGVTPFGIYWAAAARLADRTGEAALATVVSARLLSRTPCRSGNATTNLTVAVRRYRPGPEGVREAFDDFTATWRGRRDQADVATSPLLVSLSVAPTGCKLGVLGPVELGPYVVKFERHVQVQVVGEVVVLEAHATPSGQDLLDAFVVGLTDVVDECLLSSAPRQALHRVTDRAVAQSATAPVAPTGGALGRLLTATPEALVRDVGVTSFDVLSVIDDLAEGYGIRVGVETFYTWETAGDVQRFVTARSGTGTGGEGEAADSDQAESTGSTASTGSIVVPHLNDVFIDAYRRGEDDPYAVELAFVIDLTLAGSAGRLAECTRRCLARHEVWRASTRFGPEGVVLDLTGPVTPVREVVAATWNKVRDPHRLSVRNPSRLAEVAVAEVGDELGLYLNVHHLLLDHTGLEVFLVDLLTELRAPSNVAPVTWSSLQVPLTIAREQAAEVWARNPVPADALPIGPAGSVSGNHLQHRMPWGRREHDTLDLETSLRAVTTALAEFTGVRRGIVGSVHHGRTVPGSDRLVGALARVLPAAFDLDDEAVLAASARRLLTGQAALAADTRGARANGSALPMPVVFQAIRAGGSAEPGEHAGIVRRVEFEARTKFAVLLTLVAAPEGDVLEVTLSTDHYDALDLARLVGLLVRVAPGARTLELVAGATR